MIWQAPSDAAPFWKDPQPGPSPNLSITEPEMGPVPTGILDQYGRRIYREPAPRPLGFLPVRRP